MNKFKICSIICSAFLVSGMISGCAKNNLSENDGGYKETKETLAIFNNINEDIDVDRIYSTIDELASEKYLGRMTGTEGNRLARDFIKEQFEEAGLKPLEERESLLFPYEQKMYYLEEAPVMKILDQQGNTVEEIEYITDFTTYANPRNKLNGKSKGEIVFAITPEDFNDKKDSFKGKAVVFGLDVLRSSAFDEFVEIGEGLPGIMLMDFSHKDTGSEKKYVNMSQNGEYDSERESMLLARCDKSGMDKIKKAAENGHMVEYSIDYKIETKEINNVVGYMPGTDKDLQDEYIVISGHFDHLGENFNGEYNPGASDNASGTACMIEIAKALKENNIKSKRPIIFAAFNGEENGLVGSEHFVRECGIDFGKSKMLNIDMIANKATGPLYLMAVNDSKLLNDLMGISEEMGINVAEEIGRGSSDHSTFEAAGGQAVTLVEVEQTEYHTPADTIDVIEKKDLQEAVELVLRYISSQI